MTTLFLVFRGPGPAWVAGTPTREQPLWDEHAAFMDRLFEEGVPRSSDRRGFFLTLIHPDHASERTVHGLP